MGREVSADKGQYTVDRWSIQAFLSGVLDLSVASLAFHTHT